MGIFPYLRCLLVVLVLPTLGFATPQENRRASLKFDEYQLNFTQPYDEETRLSRFARRLKREPGARAYIIAYTPRVLNLVGSSHWSIAENRCLTTKAQLTDSYGVKESRLICIDGGVREAATLELWILPPGATPPQPRPEFQESEIVTCYPIRADGDGYVLKRETQLKFSVAFRLGNPNRPLTYLWTVSAGKIVGGQGQASITVEVGESQEKKVTAEVEVKGLPSDCHVRASFTTVVGVVPYKLAEFEENYSEALQANLDHLTTFLQKDPSLRGYIIVYGGRTGRRGYAEMRAEKAKYYLTEIRGNSADRFVVLQGGYREKLMFEIWLTSRNGPKPMATPSVDPRYVEFTGERKRSSDPRKHTKDHYEEP